jgi:hypothetical protein
VLLLVVEVAAAAEDARVAFAFVAGNARGSGDAALIIEAAVHFRCLVDDWVVFVRVPRALLEQERTAGALGTAGGALRARRVA